MTKAEKCLKTLEYYYNDFTSSYDFHNSESLDEFLEWYDSQCNEGIYKTGIPQKPQPPSDALKPMIIYEGIGLLVDPDNKDFKPKGIIEKIDYFFYKKLNR